jgi:hypothetical protein
MTNQLDLFDNISASLDEQVILNDDGEVILYKHFFDLAESDAMLNILVAELKWQQEYQNVWKIDSSSTFNRLVWGFRQTIQLFGYCNESHRMASATIKYKK